MPKTKQQPAQTNPPAPAKPTLVALKPRLPQPEPPKPTTSVPDEITAAKPEESPIFQAVGIIVGKVSFLGETAQIAIEGKSYPLFYAPRRKRAFAALKLNVDANSPTQRLLVYPRIIHFPGEKSHQIGFQVVGFEGKGNLRKDLGLQDFEFKLSGLWQFIPVCKIPCVSVFKNFSDERLSYVKETSSERKVAFMKASHIPVIWRDAPVKAFRFNPRLEKGQQGQVYFVSVKARFLPDRDAFEFVSLNLPPAAKPPRYLKASKEEVLKVRRQARRQQAPSSVGLPTGRRRVAGRAV